MDEETRSDTPQPEENPQERVAETPPEGSQPQQPPVGPRPGGPAQVAGCWFGLVILAALVVFVVLTIGRAIRTASQPAPPATADIDQDGLAGGSLKDGEAYKSNVTVRILGFDRYASASQESTDKGETGKAASETPPKASAAASAQKPASAQASQPASGVDYIVSGEVTNLRDKSVTYLKVHLILKDAAGQAIGETWNDVATARPSTRYIRSFGPIAPQKTKPFQGLISVAPDLTPASASAEIVALAVK